MKLLITKFIKNVTPANQYLPDNYFIGDGINVVDYVTVDKIPENSIPVFNEELTADSEPMQFKCSDYDVTLSMLDATRTNLGLTLKEFFTLNAKYIIRVMVMNNNVLKSFGFIDNSSIRFDCNISKINSSTPHSISFTVYSSELEWHNFAESKKFGDFGYINQGRHENWDENDLSFGSFMQYFLIDLNVISDDRTNVDYKVLQKYGFTPKTSPLQKAFVSRTYWQIFRDIVLGFGITYKIIPNEEYCAVDRWGKPTLVLFYRNEGLDLSTIQILERNDGVCVNNGTETFMIRYTRFAESPGTNAKYEGFIDNTDSRIEGGKHCIRINDVFNVSDGWDIYFYRNGVQEYMFREKSCVSDAGLELISWSYYDFGKWGDGNDERNYATAARFFVRGYLYTIDPFLHDYLYNDNGFDEIVDAILPATYDFLIASLKKSLDLKIVNNNLFDVTIYNKVNFKNTQYWIEKVYNTDLYERTANLKLVEA